MKPNYVKTGVFLHHKDGIILKLNQKFDPTVPCSERLETMRRDAEVLSKSPVEITESHHFYDVSRMTAVIRNSYNANKDQ